MSYSMRSKGMPSCARSRRALYPLPEDRLSCSRITFSPWSVVCAGLGRLGSCGHANGRLRSDPAVLSLVRGTGIPGSSHSTGPTSMGVPDSARLPKRVLSSILGAQETDSQHRHPEHGGVDVDALLQPHPRRRLVCRHLRNLEAGPDAKHKEYYDS